MIHAIVLAAGESRRMGMPKPLLRFGSTTFLGQIVSTLRQSRIGRITVVLGAEAERIRESIDLSGVDVVVNEGYAEGQLSSLIAGLKALPGQAEAAVVCLVDNPFITAILVDQIIHRFRQTLGPIVVPVVSGRRGHPALFSNRLFADLLAAPPQEGARHVLRAHPELIHEVDTSEQAILIHIESPDDYRQYLGTDPLAMGPIRQEES
jgi:molybdenum cofactor cytidylyltransferase